MVDPRWKIKKNEWTEDTVRALPFFEELRVMFTSEELFQQFPILLEHYLRSEICFVYTSDAAYDTLCVDRGRRQTFQN